MSITANMQLYLVRGCPFAHRASIVLQEKQLPFDPVFFQQGKRPPELEAVGPYAKSPTLFDGDNRIWDSQVVLEYLEDRYPERPVFPTEPSRRAKTRMTAAQVTAELGSKLNVVAMETVYKPQNQRDEAKVAEAIREFLAALPAWDRRLEAQPFLIGDELTIADVTLFTVFGAMQRLSNTVIPAEHTHLRAWHERIDARPSAALLEPPLL